MLKPDHAPDPLELFFASEGAYCSLLHVLLKADTPLARAFRMAFSELVDRQIGVRLDAEPVDVQPEFFVTPLGGLGQAIDLVLDREDARVAIEVKVLPSSARQGQLANQYRGLRRITSLDKRVCSLLVFPRPTRLDREVKPYLSGGDQAGHVTWDEVFRCVPSSPPDQVDVLLARLLALARGRLPVLQVPGKTRLTVEREALHDVMRQAVGRANELLASAAGCFEGCRWKPAFWRDPKLDQFYGGLRSPDGTRRRGQYLEIAAHYVPASTARDETRPPILNEVAIGFTLEIAGGAKAYGSEFKTKVPDCIKSLPPVLGERAVEKDGLRVCDRFKPEVDQTGATVGGEPAIEVMGRVIYGYAIAFRDFLLRDVPTKASGPGHVGIGTH